MSDEFQLYKQPTIVLEVKAYRSSEPYEDGTRGTMALGAAMTPVVDADNFEIGELGLGHGFVVIRDYQRDPYYETEYLISLQDIWNAFRQAAAAEDQ